MTTDLRVAVVIPWRPQAHRWVAYGHVRAWWATNFPGWDVVAVDSPLMPFSLAAARNLGMEFTRGVADVVVICDADTFGEPHVIRQAVQLAADTDEWVIPYDRYRSLMQEGSEQFYRGVPPDQCSHLVVGVAISGIYVVTHKAWARTNGQDERMVGWSPEDYAMLLAYRTLTGLEPRRIEGNVYALHHESAVKEGPAYDECAALYQRYVAAGEMGDVAAMRELVGLPLG